MKRIRFSAPALALVFAAALCAFSLEGCSGGARGGAGSSSEAAASKASSAVASKASSAAASAASSHPDIKYVSSSGAVSLSYPDGWQLAGGTGSTVCTLTAPGGAADITVTAAAQASRSQTLYALNSAALSRLESSHQGFSLIANDNIRLAGAVGYKIDFTFTQGGAQRREAYYFTLIGGTVCAAACTAPAQSYDDNALSFSNILKTIEVKQ
jgi:hypothetical protein